MGLFFRPGRCPGRPARRVVKKAREETSRIGPGKKIRAMKLTIERTALLHSLGHVQSVVARRNTVPILANVVLNSKDAPLGLAGPDRELERRPRRSPLASSSTF